MCTLSVRSYCQIFKILTFLQGPRDSSKFPSTLKCMWKPSQHVIASWILSLWGNHKLIYDLSERGKSSASATILQELCMGSPHCAVVHLWPLFMLFASDHFSFSKREWENWLLCKHWWPDGVILWLNPGFLPPIQTLYRITKG